MRLMDSIFYLAWGTSDAILGIQLQKNLANIHASYSLPEKQAVKRAFFAPSLVLLLYKNYHYLYNMLYQYIIQIENTQYLYLPTLHNTTKVVVIFTEI